MLPMPLRMPRCSWPVTSHVCPRQRDRRCRRPNHRGPHRIPNGRHLNMGLSWRAVMATPRSCESSQLLRSLGTTWLTRELPGRESRVGLMTRRSEVQILPPSVGAVLIGVHDLSNRSKYPTRLPIGSDAACSPPAGRSERNRDIRPSSRQESRCSRYAPGTVAGTRVLR